MTTTSTNAYTGPMIANGVTPLPFDFQSLSAEEIGATRNGVETTDFTVVVNGDGTGTITPNSSWGTDEVYIYSKPNYQQPANFERFGSFYPDQFNPPLDRLSRILLAVNDKVGRALRFSRGQSMPEIDQAEFAGGYLAFDALGVPVRSSGTGADAGLRTDIALASGASLIGTAEGGTLADIVARPRPLKLGAAKATATNRAEARTMAADLTNRVGYASTAGVTGGAGQTEYWVTNASDDPGFVGSLRWAIESAIAGGGGMILFDPVGSFEVNLRKLLIVGASSTNVANITIDAPGRNATIRNLPKVEGMRLSGQNIILRRVRFTNLDGTYVDGEEKDGLGINPLYTDKFWIDECEMGHISDGVGDVASSAIDGSALSTASGYCRGSWTHNIIRNQDKVIVLGKTGIVSGVLGSTYRVLATFHENWFHSVGQRLPLVQQNAFAHLVNNVIDFSPFVRQDGTQSANQGAYARFGGALDSYGNIFRSLYGTGYIGVGGDADGAYRSTGDAAEDAITLGSLNTGYIPALPYVLAPTAVPGAGAVRDAMAESIIAKCGPGETPFPREDYVFVAGAPTSIPDGVKIIPWGTGYYQAASPRDDQIASNPNASVVFPRGTTKVIAGGAIAIESGDNYFALRAEGDAPDTLNTITGFYDGAIIGFRVYDTADPITIDDTGNIDVPVPVVLDDYGKELWLHYDTGRAKWLVLAEPNRQTAADRAKLDALPTLASGTYVPTLTAVANCSALTLQAASYIRNGNIVAVSLRLTGTQTAASTLTKVAATLPVASALAAGYDLIGTSVTVGTAPLVGCAFADFANDRAEADWVCSASAGAAFTLNMNFQYEIK